MSQCFRKHEHNVPCTWDKCLMITTSIRKQTGNLSSVFSGSHLAFNTSTTHGYEHL